MKKNKRWIPEQSEKYFFCSERRGILFDYFDEKDTNCKTRYIVGNCFPTRDEASRYYDEILRKITTTFYTKRNGTE